MPSVGGCSPPVASRPVVSRRQVQGHALRTRCDPGISRRSGRHVPDLQTAEVSVISKPGILAAAALRIGKQRPRRRSAATGPHRAGRRSVLSSSSTLPFSSFAPVLRVRRLVPVSSRHSLPGSIVQQPPKPADGWIPVTSTGMTGRKPYVWCRILLVQNLGVVGVERIAVLHLAGRVALLEPAHALRG